MKTFVLIMGAGRCGSTSLVSFLNKQENFNIYGENDNVIYDLLNCMAKINNIKRTKAGELDHKYSNLSYSNTNYINMEWYNPKNKLHPLQDSLIKAVINYFDNDEKYVGFKEVRWINRKLDCLNLLEDHFIVKYVYLTRNLHDQVKSIRKLDWNLPHPIDKHILQTNSVIETFLSKKKTSQFIHKNISTDKDFLQEIHEFIVADAEKKSSSRIDNADT